MAGDRTQEHIAWRSWEWSIFSGAQNQTGSGPGQSVVDDPALGWIRWLPEVLSWLSHSMTLYGTVIVPAVKQVRKSENKIFFAYLLKEIERKRNLIFDNFFQVLLFSSNDCLHVLPKQHLKVYNKIKIMSANGRYQYCIDYRFSDCGTVNVLVVKKITEVHIGKIFSHHF